jgi:ATP-dependent exoDNAse (exonuclease V) alpha subunit
MSLLDRIKRLQLQDTPTQNRNLKPEDLSLRGTGIEKRDLDRSITAYEKAAERSITKGQDLAIAEAERKFHDALDDTIAAMERDAKAKNIILDDSQRAAFLGVMKNQCCCLIGPAGSGKTTLEKIIVSQLAQKAGAIVLNGNQDKETKKSPGIAVAAFTGRAAQQSRKAIGSEWDIPVRTMHSLLGYMPVDEEIDALDPITGNLYRKVVRRFRPTYNEACKLPYNVYIIDEAPMMPVSLFNEFVDAIHPQSRIILVGDIHQLPPVMDKSVLGYALQKWPVFELTKIHRQAEGNAIIKNAHNILNGFSLQKASNVHLLEAPSDCGGSLNFSAYIKKVAVRLKEMGHFDPYRDAMIVANSKPDIVTSTHALNEYFMSVFNPEKKVDGIIVNKRIAIHTGTQKVYFAVGDKVMNIQNNNSHNPPITNGMMGIVESINFNGKYDLSRADEEVISADDMDEEDGDIINAVSLDLESVPLEIDNIMERQKSEKEKTKSKEDEGRDQRQASHIMTIKFETGQTIECSTSGDYRRVEFGYVITCHKSQGGEYPTVIICLHSANGTLLSREWLYTAFTRARENVFVLYNKQGLARALKNQKVKGNTLQEKLRNYVIQAKSDDMDLAADPWNIDRKKFPILFNPKEIN